MIMSVPHFSLGSFADKLKDLGDLVHKVEHAASKNPELKRREDIKAALKKIRQFFPELVAWVQVTNYSGDASGLDVLFIAARTLAEEVIAGAQQDLKLDAKQLDLPDGFMQLLHELDEQKRQEEEAAVLARRNRVSEPFDVRLTIRFYQVSTRVLLALLNKQLTSGQFTPAQVFNGQVFRALVATEHAWNAHAGLQNQGSLFSHLEVADQQLFQRVAEHFEQFRSSEAEVVGEDGIPDVPYVKAPPAAGSAPDQERSALVDRMMGFKAGQVPTLRRD